MTNQVQKIEPAAQAVAVVTPTQILAQAYEKGASIEQLTQLLELQDRYYAQQEKQEKREAEKAFNLALSEFKKGAPVITKDKRVQYTKKDGSVVDYKHASLSNVVYTINDLLANHGLTATWDTNQESGLVRVTCVVSHRLGHSKSVSLLGSPDDSGGKNGIQAIGSTISYLQRYSLLAAVGLATEEQDDDGRGANLPEVKEPVTTDQAIEIDDLITEHGIEKDRFLGFFSAKVGYKLNSVEQLPADAYEAAKNLIIKQSKKAGEK